MLKFFLSLLLWSEVFKLWENPSTYAFQENNKTNRIFITQLQLLFSLDQPSFISASPRKTSQNYFELKSLLHILLLVNAKSYWVPWVTQSFKHPTLNLGSGVSHPALPWVWSQLVILSLPLPPPLPLPPTLKNIQ